MYTLVSGNIEELARRKHYSLLPDTASFESLRAKIR